jgi:hypothetical protein
MRLFSHCFTFTARARLTTIALLLALWTPPWSYAAEPPFTVLAQTETIHLGRLCSREGPGKVSEGWLPTPEQILQAEALLPKFVRANGRPKGPLSYYYRQYLGVVIGDKRLIYVNVFPRWLIERNELTGVSPSNWRTAFINICDGGEGFWGALYDPNTSRFSSPRFNGAA